MSDIDVLPAEHSVQKPKSKKQSKVILTILPVLTLALLALFVAIPSISQASRHRRYKTDYSTNSGTSKNSSTSTGSTNSGSATAGTTASGSQASSTGTVPSSGSTSSAPSTGSTAGASTTAPVSSTSSALNVPFASNLVGYWKLNGNPNGALGKDNGKVFGNVSYVPGKFGLAAHFDGNNSYIEIPDQDYFSPSTFGQKTTVSFWFKPDTYNFKGVNEGYVNFMGKSDFSTGSEWEFRLDNETAYDGFPRPERMNFYAFNSTAGLGAGSALNNACPLSAWTHVVGEIDGSNTKLYVNGKLVDQDPLSGYNIHMSNTSTPFRIGTSDKEAFLQGSISNVMIYNRNLSDSEVVQLYNTDLSK